MDLEKAKGRMRKVQKEAKLAQSLANRTEYLYFARVAKTEGKNYETLFLVTLARREHQQIKALNEI